MSKLIEKRTIWIIVCTIRPLKHRLQPHIYQQKKDKQQMNISKKNTKIIEDPPRQYYLVGTTWLEHEPAGFHMGWYWGPTGLLAKRVCGLSPLVDLFKSPQFQYVKYIISSFQCTRRLNWSKCELYWGILLKKKT